MNHRILSFPQSSGGNPSPCLGCRPNDCGHDGLEREVHGQEAAFFLRQLEGRPLGTLLRHLEPLY
jgi:hypothetical protein